MRGTYPITHEYLLDLVWAIESKPEKVATAAWYGDAYYGLALGLESQWRGGDGIPGIVEDFQKLVDIKAPVKVLICDVTAEKRTDLVNALSSEVARARLRLASEVYLALVFHRKPGEISGGPWKTVLEGIVINSSGSMGVAGEPFSYSP